MNSFKDITVKFTKPIRMGYLARNDGQNFREMFMLRLDDHVIDDYELEFQRDNKTLDIELDYSGLKQWDCMVSGACRFHLETREDFNVS